MTPLERMQSMQPYHNSYEGTPAHLRTRQNSFAENTIRPRPGRVKSPLLTNGIR